jgi:hypothetical protein
VSPARQAAELQKLAVVLREANVAYVQQQWLRIVEGSPQ